MTDRDKFEAWLLPIEEEMRQRGCGLPAVAGVYFDMWKAYQAALSSQQPADDGWIEWAGGECPVGQNQGVDVKLRGGYGDHFYGNPASYFEWSHNGLGLDIIAYRVVKP